jgi:hypothetical protein
MFLHYWQIAKAMDAAKATNPRTLVGARVNYQFVHDSDDTEAGRNNGFCGLFGWVYEHTNPEADDTEPMDLVIAFDTTIDEFFVTQSVKAVFAREQLAGDSTSLNQAEHAKLIDNVVFGPE